jgi:DNA primase small subunit
MQPKDRKTVQKASFKPVSRELVFDIDMTDYDEIRTCCSGKGICKRCWAFIAVAVKVLDEMIRQDFGYKHLLWVYSGRRGIHCWISDQEACDLSDDSRRAIVGWIDIIKGSANQTKKVDVGPPSSGSFKEPRKLHPSIQRALGTEEQPGPLRIAFDDIILRDQDCFRVAKQSETLLSLLPSSDVEGVNKIREAWAKDTNRSSQRKWQDVQSASKGKKTRQVWSTAIEDIILQYTYPRIDSEVSKHLNHLLKSPFVIHPATGKVCVPLEVDKVDNFDPIKDCPGVSQLLREMNKAMQQSGTSLTQEKGQLSNLKGYWDQTSLAPFVQVMDRHCQAILKDDREAKKGELLPRRILIRVVLMSLSPFPALEAKSFDF